MIFKTLILHKITVVKYNMDNTKTLLQIVIDVVTMAPSKIYSEGGQSQK